jgi:hypothetical protein
MGLISIEGESCSVNKRLMTKAFEEKPSLIIDCGNAADPFKLFPKVQEEELHNVFVINAEAIYRLRDSLKQAISWSRKIGARCIIVTTIHTLFSYDDETENYNVLEHCWEIMSEISKEYPLYVGIADDHMHKEFAKRFSDSMISVQAI